jgi:hypothetical protein
MSKYETNLPRAALGLVVGTVAGASLIELWFLSEVRDLQELPLALQAASAIFIYAAFFWAAGLFLVAPLPWALLHHCGMRSWLSALALGAALTFGVMLAGGTYWFGLRAPGDLSAADLAGRTTWTDGRLTLHGWTNAVGHALLFSITGALVGLVVWRTAYRRIASTG